MKQSHLFTRTLKELPKDETSYNAQTLLRAGFIDKVAAGVYSFLPLGCLVMDKIRQIIKEEMLSVGGQEVSMPAFAPKENWEATGRWDDLDVLFKISASDKKEYALNPTHEEVVTPLAKKFIYSYRELPFSVFQIQTKFRNEKRAKAGLLRGREFLMKDLYSFHTDQADLDRYYEEVSTAYERIFNRVGLGDKTYLTFASGGTFAKYSHEFQTLTESGEDLIYICDKCRLAVNKEIIADQSTCPKCGSKDLREEKAVEVGNIFKLGTKYSAPFDLSYSTQEGKKELVVMGCYGMGLSRVMGTVVEACHDDKGIVWPENIAPFKVHLVSLKENEAAEKIYQTLQAAGVEVLYDDRDLSAGEKFADADLIGCPYRILVSKKTLALDSIELKKRNEEESQIVKIKDILSYVQ
ncbi:MAG: His/Gly/Thr/Pro-type tRNA ligase C-terminal domain-containing protein [Patescibacteria group bacterium]|nr:His/Gly/Thr/Pro-type tRNA ligase C-terminal domain-containing protein [Patescibacteria group bacterium]